MPVAPGSRNSVSVPYTAHPCLTVHSYLINFTMRKIRNHLLLFLFHFCLFVLPGSEEDVLILLTDNVAIGTRKENTILCQLLEEREQMPADPAKTKPLVIHRTVCLMGPACVTHHWSSPHFQVPSVCQGHSLHRHYQHKRGHELLNTGCTASAGHQNLSAAAKRLYIHWVRVAAVEIKPRDGLSTVDVQLPCQSVQVWESQLHTANG